MTSTPTATPLPAVTVADVDAYFAVTPRDAEWQAVTTKDAFVREAFIWLGQLCMDPTRDCCGLDFNDAWLMAVSELALALSKAPTAILGGGVAQPNGGIQSQTLGDLSISYFQASSSSPDTIRYGVNDPLVLQKFPWIGDILSCYLNNASTSGTRVIARVRS